MDVLALLAAVGVGGIVAGILSPWIAGLMSGRQYSRQIDHETRMDELKRSHERQTQEQERQHQQTLRREAAYAVAAEWAVPAVARCLYWVEGLQRATETLDGTEYSRAENRMDIETALGVMFRLATEHPDQWVRHHARTLYDRILKYRRKGEEERSYRTTPDTDTLSSWAEALNILLPLAHRPWHSP